jgi:hypothetical protein
LHGFKSNALISFVEAFTLEIRESNFEGSYPLTQAASDKLQVVQ